MSATLILVILLFVAVSIGFLVVTIQQRRIENLRFDLTGANETIGQLRRAVDAREKAIAERDHIIEEMGNASRKAREAHERIRAGSDRDRFDASLSELSNDS